LSHGAPTAQDAVRLSVVAKEWGRIGCVGFGGPPAHVALLRELCVARNTWMQPHEFEDAVAATNLIPGPGSTQLAILCAWRLRGAPGAIVGGLGFILPGLSAILALSIVFLAENPPLWVRGAAAGAGAAVAAVAIQAGSGLAKPSWRRAMSRSRWIAYTAAGAGVAAIAGEWVVLALIVCGLAEVGARNARMTPPPLAVTVLPLAALSASLPALVWVSFKTGALSYGGGFVIIPLMQADAVDIHHWLTSAQFLNAVALGQITPGPVVHTVAVVGYAADGLTGGLIAAAVAFTPSFVFVLLGARHLDRLRGNAVARAFLDGAGPSAIGAILGTAIPLAEGLHHVWQAGVLAAAILSLLVLRIGVVTTLVCAASLGVVAALGGAAAP
jgi:chromate transporter